MKAVRLRTEYLVNPIGIDIVSPRLYWNAEGGTKQTAYQIIAKSGGKIIWNTGKVASSRMTHILYEGQPLHSREKVYWSVKLWDENGEGGEISTGSFEMGLLENTDWEAKWITGNYKVKKSERYPVDCFRKHISITREVKSARLYITACGLYEARLDGEKIGKKKISLCTYCSNKCKGRWSEWRDSNSRHPGPKPGALPTGPHPDIQLD